MKYALLVFAAACGSPEDVGPGFTDAAIDSLVLDTTTALTATMQNTRVLDQAYFGINTDLTLHIEAQLGGATGCPTMSSPTPRYTLILGSVPMPMASGTLTSPGNFLDYDGDMLGGSLGAAAYDVMLHTAGYAARNFIALDVMLSVAAGTVSGHLYATHCVSLDE